MKKLVVSESQILAAIKEQESGKKAADICRDLGIHQAAKPKASGPTMVRNL